MTRPVVPLFESFGRVHVAIEERVRASMPAIAWPPLQPYPWPDKVDVTKAEYEALRKEVVHLVLTHAQERARVCMEAHELGRMLGMETTLPRPERAAAETVALLDRPLVAMQFEWGLVRLVVDGKDAGELDVPVKEASA